MFKFWRHCFTCLESGRFDGGIILERTYERKVMQASSQHFLNIFSQMDTIPQRFLFYSYLVALFVEDDVAGLRGFSCIADALDACENIRVTITIVVQLPIRHCVLAVAPT